MGGARGRPCPGRRRLRPVAHHTRQVPAARRAAAQRPVRARRTVGEHRWCRTCRRWCDRLDRGLLPGIHRARKCAAAQGSHRRSVGPRRSPSERGRRSPDCVAMHVGDFDYRTAAPLPGLVDLRSAQATWCQESERSWPEKVLLEGVTYGSIRFRDTPSAAGEGETPDRDEVARRLAWVRSESRVCPAAIRATRGLVPADRPRRRPPRAPCQRAPPTPHPVPAGTGVGAPARRDRRLWLPALVGRRQAPDTAPAGHPGFR
ncbi:hypothetical protein SUDANB151_06771 [Streptomyces sp. enrichment culture]